MAKLTTPKYMKIFDLQKLLGYLLMGEKRPHYVQFNPKPQNVVIVYVDGNTGVPMDKQRRDLLPIHKSRQTTRSITKFEADLDSRGFLRVYLNENMPTADIFENILKSVNVTTISLSLITPQSLALVGTHDVVHLFSYSRFVKSQATFDSSVFKSYSKPKLVSPYFLIAVDCEMMICEGGKQVGRVSMLDHTGQVIYDKFVRPGTPVVDYLEKYSGLNAQNTSNGVSLKELEADLLQIIGTNTYLLGHGIENDLEALNLYTSKVIDTSYLFLSTEGYKVKLSELSKTYFGDTIQKSSHSPVEDALCCLKLLAYKIAQLNNFYDPHGAVLKLNTPVKTVKRLADVSRGRGLFMCRLAELDLDDLTATQETLHVVLYDTNGKGCLAFRQTNR